MDVDLYLKNPATMKTSWLVQANNYLFEIYFLKKLSQKDKYFFDDIVAEMQTLSVLKVDEKGIYSVLLALAKKGLVLYKMQVSKGVKRKYYFLTEAGKDAIKDMIPIFEHFVVNYELLDKK